MERSPPLLVAVLAVVFCCGLVSAQSVSAPAAPPVIRPPAIPVDSGGLEFRAPAPPIRPPAPPTRVGPEPRPPAPPESTDKACVVRHVGNGEFKKECVDIAARCERRNCPAGTVCGLNLDEEIECFSESVTDFQNCRPDFFRLAQPCPADAGIRGFGMGCNYCFGANPFLPGPEPPAASSRRLTDFSPFPRGPEPVIEPVAVGPPSPPSPPLPPGPPSDRACLVVYVRDGMFKTECVDIAEKCARRNCASDEVCGLDHDENVTCFPGSVREFENCLDEEFRLEQPCPADSGITGFGMGCTFCHGANPFLPRSLSGRELIPEELAEPDSACVSVYVGGGNFKQECRSIKAECEQKQCPEGTICGIDLEENTTCFDESVTSFQNCGPPEFRLDQPCPADAGIRGFGMGCTFCEGGNPFVGPEPAGPTPPTPPPGLPSGQTMAAGSDQSITNRVACVSRVTDSGAVRRGCMDITELCQRRRCPADRTCALDPNEQPSCFAPSQLPVRNCGTTRERVAQPCPEGTEVVAFGAGCTFCRPPPTAAPPPAADAPRRACVVSGSVRRCETISARCAGLACAETCAIGLDGEARCFVNSDLPSANCGPERRRLDQPCAAGHTAVAFGAGCTFCRPQ